jgi:hypothetical protein
MANAPTHQQKQEATDRRISLLLLLSAHASLRIKSKGLLINAPYNLYYFSYVPSTAQKKARGSIGMSSKFSTRLIIFSKVFHSSVDIDGLARPLTPQACPLVFIGT